jgi:hypothetical protein
VADGIIQVDPDSTGKKVDTEQLTVGANTVERQRGQVAGALAAEIAAVLNANPTTEYGLVVRNIPSGTQAVSGTVGVTSNGSPGIGDGRRHWYTDRRAYGHRAKSNPGAGIC